MYRKYNDYDSSSEDEGFHEAEIKIIDNIPPAELLMEAIKLGDARQIQNKVIKPNYSCYTIYTKINFISYPLFLYYSLDDSSVKMNKKKQAQSAQIMQARELGEFLKTGNFICKYNKFESKLDFKSDMTCHYKSFEYLLQPLNSHYKQLTGKDVASKQDIEFSSNFESGNLQFVFGKDNTYYLLLQNDMNTKGYNQWFYFRIKNKRKCKVKLIILNITKPAHLLKNAMGISIFSMQQKSFCRKHWTEGGVNVRLYKNGLKRKSKSNNSQYYSLEFDYQLKFESDTVYFALNTPFPYTKLLHQLDQIMIPARQNILINVKNLGKTVSNNNVYSIEFTATKKIANTNMIRRRSISIHRKKSQTLSIEPLERPSQATRKRKSIVFMGRQHPCETNSSYILEGIINFLSEQSDVSLFLLEQYDIYIIPMANPDGVIHGHSRTNLSGYDMNRLWSQPDMQKSSEVCMIIDYLRHLNQTTQIKYVIDFHSHSKKLNTFGYFCEDSVEMRTFAWYLEDTNPNFNYQSCTFGKNKSKQKTFRYFAYHDLGIKQSITIEVSFFGKLEHGLYRRYNTKHLYDIGISILKAVGEFSQTDMVRVLVNNFIRSNVPQNIGQQEFSESDPEEDYLDQRERVKVILTAKRQKQEQMSKGINKNLHKPNNLKKLSSLNKTMVSMDRENTKTTTVSTKMHTSPEKPFKPYSQEQMLKDDSVDQAPVLKRRLLTEPRRTQTRFYTWDQDKFNVNKLISYPTSLQPYLEPFRSDSAQSLDSQFKKRKGSHKYSLTTQAELQKLIIESKVRQHEKYQYIVYEQNRKKCRLPKNQNKRLLTHTLMLSSIKDLQYP